MKNKNVPSFLKFCVFMALFLCQTNLTAQQIHYSTLHGDCEDVESTPADCREPPHCCHRYHFPSQQPDPMAEELFEDSGWAGRRDDELSDYLMR